MTLYFNLSNDGTQLLKSVGETIKAHYPIGVNRQSQEYDEYPGIKKLDAIVTENVTSNRKFYAPWKSFLDELRKKTKCKIHNTSLPTEISFSGELILERYEDDSLRRVKKIKFAVSLFAPFYSICGVDETFIKEKDDELPLQYHAINIITVSPYKEFENSFKLIEENIKNKYYDHVLVPVESSLMLVEKIQSITGYKDESTVYSLLFNESLDKYNLNHWRGDLRYGYNK